MSERTASKGLSSDTVSDMTDTTPPPIEGRASTDPPSFDWRFELEHMQKGHLTRAMQFYGEAHLPAIIAHQLAELLNLLEPIQIPSWLMKKK